jgi:hypothetical protein
LPEEACPSASPYHPSRPIGLRLCQAGEKRARRPCIDPLHSVKVEDGWQGECLHHPGSPATGPAAPYLYRHNHACLSHPRTRPQPSPVLSLQNRVAYLQRNPPHSLQRDTNTSGGPQSGLAHSVLHVAEMMACNLLAEKGNTTILIRRYGPCQQETEQDPWAMAP